MRTVIPIDCGQRFRWSRTAAPVDGFKGSLGGVGVKPFTLTHQSTPALVPSFGSIGTILPPRPGTRLVPARTVAVKDGPSSGHRVSGAQRP